MTRIQRAALLAVLAVAAAPSAHAAPTLATHHYSEVRPSLAPPVAEVVVLVAWKSELDQEAALEAVDYWNWLLPQAAERYPQLSGIVLLPRVLGRDAVVAEDAQRARIVIGAALASPVLADLAAGLRGTAVCVVDGSPSAHPMLTVPGMGRRNFAVQGIGHCLGAGTTGTPFHPVCDPNGDCGFIWGDVMGYPFTWGRQCVSTLNLQALAEANAWRTSPDAAWAPDADGGTYAPREAYARTCMPVSMVRF